MQHAACSLQKKDKGERIKEEVKRGEDNFSERYRFLTSYTNDSNSYLLPLCS